jgi:uncharacterized protein (DUF1501 family)
VTVHRRDFLRLLAASSAMGALGVPSLSFASAATDKRLVVVLLRFGMDGLAALAPHGDPHYRSARGSMALPLPGEAEGVLDLDGTFGLHPALAPIRPLWEAGELGFVHAAAVPYRGRSHFEGQDVLENGTDKPHATADGWLARAIGALGERPDAVAIGQAMPLLLRGEAGATTVDPLHEGTGDAAFLEQVQKLYAKDAALDRALREALLTRTMVEQELGDEMDGKGGGKGGKRSPIPSRRLAEAAGKLLAADDGPRVMVVETGGWDTHAGQGLSTGGLATRLAGLADAFVALKESLGPAWSETVVVAASEFGRTVAGNGTGGTDHGTGGLVWLLGGAVAGGKVHGIWPGLATSALHEERDLAPANDVRGIFKGLLRDHLGVTEAALEDTVFPASRDVAGMTGLIRA